MRSCVPFSAAAALAVLSVLPTLRAQVEFQTHKGERMPAAAISPLVVESMDQVLERARTMPVNNEVRGIWNGQDGRWFVPPEGAKTPVHSGSIAIVNEWGDPRIGIGFPGPTDVRQVWAAGHGAAPARAVLFVAFRGGKEIARTEWIPLAAQQMQRVELKFAGVDRIEVVCAPFIGRTGFVALDDLQLSPAGQPAAARELDFEDLTPRMVLTGTAYQGLTWESGRGLRAGQEGDIVPAPKLPADAPTEETPGAGGGGHGTITSGVSATSPRTWNDFIGVTQGDPGATLIPPDTCGATGLDHYVVIVNANLSAFVKNTGARVLNVSLGAFWNVTGLIGDPRIVFDPHSQRFVALADTFSGTRRVYLAVSETADPTGTWFKFFIQTDTGTDAGRWPDYPTLGVDARGIYTASYMVGGTGSVMTLWAIDKAPLLATPPAVGTVTAFRSLPFEGAIQPCTTYGDPGVQYVVSRRSSTLLRVRHVAPPLTAPTLVETGSVTVPSHSTAPNAPALGSTTSINTLDTRPLNAVFRNGSIWTVHGVSASGRAAGRWYELRTTPLGLAQSGTIADPLWHYYYTSVAVDAAGNVGFGFSGSHAGVYCSTFVTGRRASDPPGLTAPPILVKAGEASWNRLDGSGRNRFGDYSFIDVDPVDDLGFWTSQEYIFQTNVWRTRVTRLGFEAVNYGDGLAGTANVPTLATVARPVIGQTLGLQLGNSHGSQATAGVLVMGISPAAIPAFGGTVLVSPVVLSAVTIPVSQVTVNIPVPNDPSLVGNPVYFQSLQLDAGAVQGLAFSPGLEVRPSSR